MHYSPDDTILISESPPLLFLKPEVFFVDKVTMYPGFPSNSPCLSLLSWLNYQ